jgi:hypothetical protein
MSTDAKRAILERLSQGSISMDEAEQELARLDDPDVVGPEPVPTRVLPAHDPDAPTEVHVELDSSADIEIVGRPGALEPYLEGPHSVEVHENDGVFEVRGRLGDDGLLVVPADADLTLQANGSAVSLTGIRGSLDAELNVGRADIRAAFTRGQSRIDANVGKLHIGLDPRSNVRIQVTSATSIRVSDDLVKTGRGAWTYGDGDAALEISGNISRVVVDLDADVDVQFEHEDGDVVLTDAGSR